MTLYVGLDVHCKKSVYEVQDENGRIKGKGEIPTTTDGFEWLYKKHELVEGTQVALETGTMAYFTARQLAGLELKPVVVDAHEVRIKAHRPRQKSDTRDAHELCEGLRRGMYRSIVHIPPKEIQDLRQTLSRRRHFVRVTTMEKNAARYLIRSAGLGDIVKSIKTEKAWGKMVDAIEGYPELQRHVEMHHEVCQAAHSKVAELDAELELLCRPKEEDIKRLQTVPGVGPIVAMTVVATLSDITRFEGTKPVASYVGLAPTTNQSGSRNTQGHISKRGSTECRAMLVEAAHHARKVGHPLNPYFTKLCAKKGYKVATAAVAHRLLRILYAMLRKREDFDIGKLNVERVLVQRPSVRIYRLKMLPVIENG